MKIEPGMMFVTVESTDNPNSISAPKECAKADKEFVYQVGYDSKEGAGIFYKGFCFPAQFASELKAICETRQELRKAYDDSMSLVYQLVNKVHNS